MYYLIFSILFLIMSNLKEDETVAEQVSVVMYRLASILMIFAWIFTKT
jgi:hypothetical protein